MVVAASLESVCLGNRSNGTTLQLAEQKVSCVEIIATGH